MIKLTNPLFYMGRIIPEGETLQLSTELEQRIVKNGNGYTVAAKEDNLFDELKKPPINEISEPLNQPPKPYNLEDNEPPAFLGRYTI